MNRGRGVLGLLVGLLACAALVAASPAARLGVAQAVALLAEGDIAGIRGWVVAAGIWAPLALAGLMVLQAVLAPLPSSPVTYASGLIYGVWWGGLLAWASALVAAALCFGLSRRLGRSVVERMVGRHAVEWSDAFFGRFGLYAVLVGRLLPIVSFDVVSYGAGLTRMSFGPFLVGTAVGMVPGTLLYSYLGQVGGSSGRALLLTLAGLTALGVLVLGLRGRLAARLVAGRSPGPARRGPAGRHGAG